MSFDTALFEALNSLAGSSALLDSVAVFFASYSQFLWVLFLLILYFIPSKKMATHREMVSLSIIAALVARYAVKNSILFFYSRPRPFEVSEVHQLVVTPIVENFQSFPSGHALFFFAIATVIFLFRKDWGVFAYAAAILMGIARVYAGVHWPSDILAGALLGILVGWGIVKIYGRYLPFYLRPFSAYKKSS